ncbi:hypothetical protein Ocin01_01494 [Orchesella cincta]|uniref:Spaetzle domain-containing protein n=1 Tax=Orchesella cincta TaxID=48709 RepID=A0A1D2NIZ8_ORCCI|nr:hypothetical protein Ocin01_01494 [Orchesella cincta]
MSVSKIPSLLAIVVVVGCAVGSLAESNSSKPVIFITTPDPTNISDSGNAESRVNQKIITEYPVGAGINKPDKKQVVSSQGYQLEVIEDKTSEEAPGQSQKGSESQLNIFPTGTLGVDQYIQGDYDENSAKEVTNEEYAASKGRVYFDDVKPRSDISKVREIFVNKQVSEKKHDLPIPTPTDAYDSPPQTPHESKYKLEYESPKYVVNSPVVLKQSILPIVQASPISLPLNSPHDHHEIDGHTAGYGHGFHHHQQKLKSKPLKPSVVYRDPSDRFDHHDKIRTLDKDSYSSEKGPHHPHDHYEPHGHVEKGHEFNAYRHGKKVHHQPAYYYDQGKIPECAHKNKYIYNLTFCLDDPHYPTETIVWALKESGHHSKKLLSDVTYQSADNLVTGLTRAVEEGYTYKHYFGATHAQNVHLDKYKPPYHGYTYSTDYFKKGGYICPSDIYYARPKRAMNTYGKWKVIVNVDHVPEHGHDKHGHHGKDHGHDGYGKDHHGHDSYGKDHGHDSYGKDHGHDSYGKDHHGHDNGPEYGGDSYLHAIKKREYKEHKKSYTQTLRLEQCIYPNAPCSYVDSHYHSRCIQKHNFVRLVAWTHEEGLHVDTFKMPIACSCHVRQPIHFYHESGHHEHKQGHVVPPVDTYHHGHGHHPHHHETHGLKKLY